MSTRILKPGILISCKSTLNGGIHYTRQDMESEPSQNGESVTKWKTTRVIDDVSEHERAVKVRGKAVNLIRAQCAITSFGLLCPTDRESQLDDAVQQASNIAREFNREARYSHIAVFVLKGRIAEDDAEALRALSGEVRGLLDDMENGIRKLDVKAIREAANAAKSFGQMLEDKQAEQVKAAIKVARDAARAIVKRVEKSGEDAETVLRDLQLQPIETARFAFLDTEESQDSENLPAVDLQRFADIEGEFEDEVYCDAV